MRDLGLITTTKFEVRHQTTVGPLIYYNYPRLYIHLYIYIIFHRAPSAKMPVPQGLQKSLDSTKVDYRRLGNSGLKVSVPIFGCMSFGDSNSIKWVLNEDEVGHQSSQLPSLSHTHSLSATLPLIAQCQALPLLKHAYDRGINSWDTANMYSNGASEVIVGKALKKYNIPREKVVIMTKCFWGVGEEPELMHFMHRPEVEASKDYVNQHGLSRAAIFNQVEASLKRLDTPYIDLLQIHRFDYDTPIEETMKALHDLVEQGKIRYIGASSMWYVQTPALEGRFLSRRPTSTA